MRKKSPIPISRRCTSQANHPSRGGHGTIIGPRLARAGGKALRARGQCPIHRNGAMEKMPSFDEAKMTVRRGWIVFGSRWAERGSRKPEPNATHLL